MKQTRIIMGMPITVEIVDKKAAKADIRYIFDYFTYIDKKFSTYKKTSEISKINSNKLKKNEYSTDMKTVLILCNQTKRETYGYFDIFRNGKMDPSGLVKGWALQNAVELLREKGYKNFYIDAGGDIQVSGKNKKGKTWTVGIRNPLNRDQIVKVLAVKNKGVATSGTYIRGNHIYNPNNNIKKTFDIVSITVIGPNIYDADRFATAAFAMGQDGISFISQLPGLDAYMIDKNGKATYTNGFDKYVL